MAVGTFQFALQTEPRHERAFARWTGCRRWVYNELLKKVLDPIAGQRIEERAQTGRAVTRHPSTWDLQKMLPALKKQHPWLAHPPSHTLQQAVVGLSAALLRVKDGAGFPKPKRKGRSTESFRENDPAQFRVDQKSSRIKVPKLSWVRYFNSRTLEGTLETPGTNVRAKAGLNRAILDQVYEPALLGLRAYQRGQPTRASRVPLRLVRSCRERRHQRGEEPSTGRAGPGGSSDRRTSAATAASPRTRQKARLSQRWPMPQAGIPTLQGREEVKSAR